MFSIERKALVGYGLIALVLAGFFLITGQLLQQLPAPTEYAQHTRESLLVGRVMTVRAEEETWYELIPYVTQFLDVAASNRVFENIGYQTALLGQAKVAPGDKVLVGFLEDEVGEYAYVIDVWRLDTLAIVAGIFLIMMWLIIGKASVRTLIGLGISFYVIISFLVPFIAYGYSPLLITFISILVIIPSTFFIVHGFGLKTLVSTAATIITLSVTGLMAYWAIGAAKLTGVVYDDVLTLLATSEVAYYFPGLILAGILISALGILDDVTIAQASLTEELYKTGTKKSIPSLYRSAMRVGKDHIVSVINTLLLVYAGAMLPTFLLFSRFPQPLLALINNEIIALELTAGLIGSMALMAAIPATTLLASVVMFKLRPVRAGRLATS
jgi:uncharacterized membrane protein